MISITVSIMCPGIGEDLFRAAGRLYQWSGGDGSFV